MVRLLAVVLAVAMFSVVLSKPLEQKQELERKVHHLWKRFINPALTSGFYHGNQFSKIRTRRNTAEDCEKLELCKLHARSSRNFLAAYELYFVNKENARLWDHKSHTAEDCDRRFAHCFGNAPAHARAPANRDADRFRFRNDDYDYNY